MEPYYFLGGALAAWAVLVSLLGVMREDFPSWVGERAVVAISVLLVAGTIGAAVIGSMNEEHDEDKGSHEEAALVLSA